MMNNEHYKSRKFRRTLWHRALAVSLAISLLTGAASAGTKTWSGSDNNDANWTSNGNWAGIGGGRPNDDLIFPAGAARLNNLNNFPVNTSFNSLTFKGRGYVFSGSQIFLKNGITIDVPSGSGQPPAFNLNTILDLNQTWKSKSGFINMNGVLNLNGNTLVVDTDLQGSLVLNGLVNGTGVIEKRGTGGLTINGDADGFGSTNLKGGTLNVRGTLGSVLLNDGTLIGDGSVGGIFANCGLCEGTIAPGFGAATTAVLTSNGLVTLSSGVTFAVDINGGENDQLRVVGSNADLNGATLKLALAPGFVPAVGQQFTIVFQSGTGNVTGQFAQGNGIIANGQIFSITYSAGSVVLTAQGPFNP